VYVCTRRAVRSRVSVYSQPRLQAMPCVAKLFVWGAHTLHAHDQSTVCAVAHNRGTILSLACPNNFNSHTPHPVSVQRRSRDNCCGRLQTSVSNSACTPRNVTPPPGPVLLKHSLQALTPVRHTTTLVGWLLYVRDSDLTAVKFMSGPENFHFHCHQNQPPLLLHPKLKRRAGPLDHYGTPATVREYHENGLLAAQRSP
jgi:hypothetical protein